VKLPVRQDQQQPLAHRLGLPAFRTVEFARPELIKLLHGRDDSGMRRVAQGYRRQREPVIFPSHTCTSVRWRFSACAFSAPVIPPYFMRVACMALSLSSWFAFSTQEASISHLRKCEIGPRGKAAVSCREPAHHDALIFLTASPGGRFASVWRTVCVAPGRSRSGRTSANGWSTNRRSIQRGCGMIRPPSSTQWSPT